MLNKQPSKEKILIWVGWTTPADPATWEVETGEWFLAQELDMPV